jgi:hypothetical protein
MRLDPSPALPASGGRIKVQSTTNQLGHRCKRPFNRALLNCKIGAEPCLRVESHVDAETRCSHAAEASGMTAAAIETELYARFEPALRSKLV